MPNAERDAVGAPQGIDDRHSLLVLIDIASYLRPALDRAPTGSADAPALPPRPCRRLETLRCGADSPRDGRV
jgi:hypothetical protein